MSEVIETPAGRFWMDDDGILRCVVKPDRVQNRGDAEESLQVLSKLAAGTLRPLVLEADRLKALDRDARVIYMGPDAARVVTAVAMVVSTAPMARAVLNFMLSVRKPAFPTRFFENVESALQWARGFRS